jgi:hypothetical protein
VQGGGNLVALHPDKKLASLLGLADAGGTLANGYLRVDTASAPGTGIAGDTMQFHGTADRYALAGARAVATLYSNATTATANPAVTLNDVGSAGGQAAAFAFDLSRSIVYTRQGNPAWAGQERDGEPGIRPNDLFFGASATDPQPDWLDTDKIAIPQADEQQRLLVNLVTSIERDRKPVPRFWYFPRDLKAAIVMTGDDHAVGGTAGRFDQYAGREQAGLLGRRLGVRARDVVHVRQQPHDGRAGPGVHPGRLRDRAARRDQQRLRRVDAVRGRHDLHVAAARRSRRSTRTSRRRSRTARTASPGTTGRPSRRRSSCTACASTRTTTRTPPRGSRRSRAS